MTALKDLLAAAEAADNGTESDSIIDNGRTRRNYRTGETEARRMGTVADAETGEPVEVYAAGPGGLLYAPAALPAPEPEPETVTPEEFGDRIRGAMDTGETVTLPPVARRMLIPQTPAPAGNVAIDWHAAAELELAIDEDTPATPETMEVVGPTGRTVIVERDDPAPADTERQDGAPIGYQLEERYHSKRRFTFYQVTLADRVDRETFNELRAACILANGWYNKAWAGESGGFAFRSQETAREFANEHLGPPDGPQGPGPGQRDRETPAAPQDSPAAPRSYANKLRALADTMQGAIDDKLSEREENTPKRRAQAARARVVGYQLERAQVVMRRLSELWESGRVPAVLENVHTRTEIVEAMACQLDEVPNGYHAYRIEARPLRARRTDAVTEALWEIFLSEPVDDSEELDAARELKERLAMVQRQQIPGYFPTPPDIVRRVHKAADIQPTSAVLEPSAGDGALLQGLPVDEDAGGFVMACEINAELCEVLQLRGIDARPVDFLELNLPTVPMFDRVIMNPPFEKLQDIDHVQRAWEHLAPGGILVAIMSPGWTFHRIARAEAFRAWVEELGGEWEDLPADSFKAAGTSVNTGMLTLRK